MKAEEEVDGMTILKREMIDEVCGCEGALFKSQQLGEPELRVEQKQRIAEALVDSDPGAFLARFSPYLRPKHIAYFRSLPDQDYRIAFYIRQMENPSSHTRARVRNRRLEAVRRMVIEGDYFSETEMKRRNPLLYEELIGRYLSQEEKIQRDGFDYSNAKLSQVLLEKYDRDMTQKLLEKQIDEHDAAVEEEDEDDEEGAEHYAQQLWGDSCMSEAKQLKREKKSDIEKKMLFEEFRSHMFSNFLQGKDDFDYSVVDTNPDYDDLDELQRDDEERYFDSESPTPMDEENELQQNGVILKDNGTEEECDADTDPLDVYMRDIIASSRV